MIKSLSYSVTFPTNGISLNGSYEFEPGLTAVTGGNGSGKTFGTIEMIRYMFFGKRALRGPASDYKTLKARMIAEIAGEQFLIERDSKNESLKDHAGELLAVGAEAVNLKLQGLLGMSLDVFDVVCAAVQKESDRLSKLTPLARKQLIDKTVGLSANEAVEKDCKDEARTILREADALRAALSEPIDPVMPADYAPSDVLENELALLRQTLDKARALQKIVDAVGDLSVEPDEAVPDIAALESHEQDRVTRAATVAAAERQLKAMPVAKYTAEQLDAYEQINIFDAERRARGDQAKYTLAEIEAWETYFEAKALAERLGDLEMECPVCGSKFEPGEAHAEPPVGDVPSRADLREARAAHDRWSVPSKAELPVGTGWGRLTTAQIAEGRIALGQEALRADLLATTWLKIPEDKSAELRAARNLEAAWVVHKADKLRWHDRSVAADVAAAEICKLPVVSAEQGEALQRRFTEAKIYESQLEAWMNTSEAYRVALEEIEDRVRRAEDFKLGAKRLAETRLKFKSHLVPMLSRIASSLIAQMTGDVLTSVIVDEDMNITVNGQDIATLSGAGSTVANLALRVALGQVLVKGVLPLFMADEADSDMEAARAEYTMECLANLDGQLRQIIVITHKPVKFTEQILTLPSNVSVSD